MSNTPERIVGFETSAGGGRPGKPIAARSQCARTSLNSPCSKMIGFLSATACLISSWQYGLCSTPEERNRMKAAARSMPFSMPSLVRSSARLSYHALKPMRSSSR